MVARLTPVQKVASSILVRPNLLASDANFFLVFCFSVPLLKASLDVPKLVVTVYNMKNK